MYVMEGMGAVLPVTSEMAHAVAASRMRTLGREANQSRFGFGDFQYDRGSIARTPGLLDRFGASAADFMSTWGVPIGVGLGAAALGLVMAKTLRKKKRG